MRTTFACTLAVFLVSAGIGGSATAAVWYVDGANASCSDAGAGTVAQPFCTIGKGASVTAPGDTVNVAAGVYREQVTLPVSGAAGLPITFLGAPGAVVVGTNALSGAGLWTLEPGSTTLYSASFDPQSATQQVFVDGNRITGPMATLAEVTANSFFFDNPNNRLYVDIGGDNPGNHAVEAGARSFGFNIDGSAVAKTDLVVEGFEVRGQNTSAIRVRTASRVIVRNNRLLRTADFVLVVEGTTTPTTTDDVEVSGNEVSEGLSAGIRLRNNVTLALVADNASHHNGDHGLLATATTNSRFTGNTFYANAKPGGQFTTGLRLDGNSDGNQVVRNVAFENQDSGFQVSGGSDANLLVRNLSFANQDHGFDVRENDGTRLISNTAHGNLNDGFSIEGGVTNASLRNNIASENGVLTGGNDLWVDTTSTGGFSSDYDVFWRPPAVPGASIEFGGGVYPTLADFAAATPHEDHGVGADPNFSDPAADDFHPGLGPAIDSADAGVAGFELLDLEGTAPIDLPGVPDTGAGVPSYVDRGALEYRDAAPSAKLTVSPKKVKIGDLVTADGSASRDDVGIVTYRFDWGDGTSTTQSGPVATHAYASKGVKHVRLTVTDGAGLTSSQQKVTQVR